MKRFFFYLKVKKSTLFSKLVFVILNAASFHVQSLKLRGMQQHFGLQKKINNNNLGDMN